MCLKNYFLERWVRLNLTSFSCVFVYRLFRSLYLDWAIFLTSYLYRVLFKGNNPENIALHYFDHFQVSVILKDVMTIKA